MSNLLSPVKFPKGTRAVTLYLPTIFRKKYSWITWHIIVKLAICQTFPSGENDVSWKKYMQQNYCRLNFKAFIHSMFLFCFLTIWCPQQQIIHKRIIPAAFYYNDVMEAFSLRKLELFHISKSVIKRDRSRIFASA